MLLKIYKEKNTLFVKKIIHCKHLIHLDCCSSQLKAMYGDGQEQPQDHGSATKHRSNVDSDCCGLCSVLAAHQYS